MSNERERPLRGVSDINLGVEIIDGKTLDQKTVTMEDGDFSECPDCGSTDISYDVNGIEPEGTFVYRCHACRKCGTSWDERYDLVQVTIQRLESEDEMEEA